MFTAAECDWGAFVGGVVGGIIGTLLEPEALWPALPQEVLFSVVLVQVLAQPCANWQVRCTTLGKD